MKKLLVLLLFLITTNSIAQEKVKLDSTSFKSIDGIVNEMLRLISTTEGKSRNLEAFRNLFLPSATFTVNSHDESFEKAIESVSLDDFIEILKDPYYEKGFLEYEISKVVEEYNGIAHVFQTFRAKDSDNYEETGINSYQMVYFGDRWYILNVLWTGESNGVKVPEKYLGD